MNEIEALTILTGAPLFGPVKVRLLIEKYGSALAAIGEEGKGWEALPGFGKRVLESWRSFYQSRRWRENLDLVEKFGVTLLPYSSSDYPELLAKIPDAPPLLYLLGDLSALSSDAIAIVGTRQASIYGIESAGQISRELSERGYVVVSGLARGIDTAAHRAALKGGKTVAVIGSGLANIYPRENGALAKEIAQRGALVSEYLMATPPERQNFPQRNRIVSGLSLGTLLVEAPLKSGAMITVERAIGQRREVFALPGRVDSDSFRGNLSLLKGGRAHLIESGGDIAAILHPERGGVQPKVKPRAIDLDDEERALLSLMPKEELSIDKLGEISQFPIVKINVLIMGLLLKCAIKEYPGKMYKKLV